MNIDGLDFIAAILEANGLTVAKGPYFFDVYGGDQVDISVEARPGYCNRGSFMVKAFSRDPAVLTIDAHDGFPRYRRAHQRVHAPARDLRRQRQDAHIRPARG